MTVLLNLAPALLARAEAQAAREGRTVEQVVSAALDDMLDPEPATPSDGAGQDAGAPDQRSGWLYEDRDGQPLPFPVFYGGTGLAPGVDGRSNASLLAAADAAEDARVLRSLGHAVLDIDT